MKYSIGIDIGTTTVKCILFGEGVQVVAEAGREYKTLLPKASWAQQNPEDWWKGVAESIRSILTESRVAPEDIKVISVSSQAPAVLPMTKEGKPLHDALIWMDRRSTKELEILEENINDDQTNCTRFIVVTNQKVFLKHAQKISICLELPHESGSLYRLLSHFIYNDLNMTRIESRPIEGKNWEYRFFIDFEGNMADPAVKNAIRGLREESRNMRILGNY